MFEMYSGLLHHIISYVSLNETCVTFFFQYICLFHPLILSKLIMPSKFLLYCFMCHGNIIVFCTCIVTCHYHMYMVLSTMVYHSITI